MRLASPGAGSRNAPGLAAELDDLQVGVDHHARRRIALEDGAAHLALEHLLGRRSVAVARPAARQAGGRVIDRERHRRRSRAVLLAVDAQLLVDQREQVALRADGLGLAEHQEAVRLERVVEHREQLPLQLRVQVDEDVAAEDQVEPRERRIPGEVLAREDAQVAHHLADAVAAVDPREEAAQPLGDDVGRDARRIDAGARVLDGASR